MSDNPLVSILVPLYNKAEWVESTVRSALEQTHQNLEVLIVDDGSTDGSAAVVERSGDDRVRVIRRENRGANATRNELLQLAAGEFIQYLDADDLLLPNKLAIQLAGLRSGADVSLCPAWLNHVGAEMVPQPGRLGSTLQTVEAGLPTSSPLHRRESVVSVGGWTDDLQASQEYDLHLRLCLGGFWQQVHTTPTPLWIIRTVAGSTSDDDLRVYRSKSLVLQRMIQTADADHQPLLASALVNAARHLARAGEFGESYEAIRIAQSADDNAIQAFPARLRWLRQPRALANAELLDFKLRRAIERIRPGRSHA